MTEWKLIKVNETEWKQDTSDIFTLIACCPNGDVRLDVMSMDVTEALPIISFQGKAKNVRKVAVRWLAERYPWRSYADGFSAEHASYIGSELARAELLKDEYVQD